MKADVKEDWIEALRSGEHFQTTDRLEDVKTGEQCCLGVLCDILDLEWRIHNGKKYYNFVAGEWRDWDLPDGCLGLSNLEIANLIHMNDSGATFDEIADYIEAML